MELTQGTLLGGRIPYAQPRDGYRTGIEPVLLAASIPARQGDRVLEAGLGAGAGLLCLLARVPGIVATGVEIDPDMAALARHNLPPSVTIVTGDILAAAVEPVDHAFANPPWHDPSGSASPLARRRLAKQGRAADWLPALARTLRPGGTLTLILPPAAIDDVASASAEAGRGAVTLRRFLPKPGREAKIVLLRATAGLASIAEMPPITLHQAAGCFTPALESILRDSAAIDLQGPS